MQQQQPNTNMNMNIMQQPPQMITSKDLMYIKDMLSWNLLAVKKASFLAQHCQDQQVKAELEQCSQMHQQHYNKLLNYLSPSYSQQLGTQQQTYQQ